MEEDFKDKEPLTISQALELFALEMFDDESESELWLKNFTDIGIYHK